MAVSTDAGNVPRPYRLTAVRHRRPSDQSCKRGRVDVAFINVKGVRGVSTPAQKQATRQEEVSPEDLASIERAATDYIEAWLTGDADRMADCLHAELTKRAMDDDAMRGQAPIGAMSYGDMVEATRDGRGANLPREYEVTVQDAFRNIATARVDSARYIDLLHIVRFRDRWRIVSVLWEPRQRA